MTLDATILLGAISALGGVVGFLWKQITEDKQKDTEELQACLQRERTLLLKISKLDNGK